jgi:hypothetical protein
MDFPFSAFAPRQLFQLIHLKDLQRNPANFLQCWQSGLPLGVTLKKRGGSS